MASDPSGTPRIWFGGGESGGGTKPPADAQLLLRYVDSRVELAKREIMTELDTKIDEIETQLSGLPSSATIWKASATIVGGVFTAVGLLFAILSWTGDRVDGAISASSSFNERLVESEIADQEQEKAIEEVDRKLDLLIATRQSIRESE